MTKPFVRVQYRDRGLAAMIGRMSRGSVALRTMLTRWAFVYMAFIRDRYNKLSRQVGGSAEWPALAPFTVRKKGSRIILKETGALFNALTVGSAGNLLIIKSDSVITGIGGPGGHPIARMTFEQLATIHQNGRGRIPARPIFVFPNRVCVGTMILVARTMVVGP